MVPFPVSEWNGVRVPQVVQTPLPFHPTLGSSMRPSVPLAKKPNGYRTRITTHLPFCNASSESLPLPVAIGVFLPSPSEVARAHDSIHLQNMHENRRVGAKVSLL